MHTSLFLAFGEILVSLSVFCYSKKGYFVMEPM